MPNIPADIPLRKHWLDQYDPEVLAQYLRERHGYKVYKHDRLKILTATALVHDRMVDDANSVNYLTFIRESLAVKMGVEIANKGGMAWAERPSSDPYWGARQITASVGIIMPREKE
jgi:hypothetical protein